MRFRRFLAALLALMTILLTVPAAQVSASAAAKYYITVDLTNQIVTVYDNGKVNNAGIVRQMICSAGKKGTPTPTGTFKLPAKSRSSERSEWYYFSKYKCYAKWATRITGGILFHSVLYTAAKKGPTSSSVNALGSPASHGCIRLKVADAKWIAKNCPAGTKCKIYYSGKSNSSLKKKLKKSTFVRADQSYDSYLGGSSSSSSTQKESKLPLANGSTGSLVVKLQSRLTELGFLNDVVDGIFGSKTLSAVQAFQTAMGLKKTTKVDQALWDKIFANNAPTGMEITLSQGSKGPAVTTLQNALIALKLLNGAADGAYGAKTTAAVKQFQQNYGYTVNGKADSALQKAIINKANALKNQFGDQAYKLVSTSTEVQMARVKVSSSLNLRKSASTSAKVLASLKNGTTLRVLGVTGSWVKVEYGSITGYVSSAYVTLYTGTVTTVDYVSADEPATSVLPDPEDLLTDPISLGVLTPIEAEEDAGKIDPEETTEPAEPAEPVEENEPAEPAEPAEATEPTEPVEESATAEPEDTPEPAEPTEPVEPTEPMEEPADTSETADPTEPTDPTEPAETSEEVAAPASGWAIANLGGATVYAAPEDGAEPMFIVEPDVAMAVDAVKGGWVRVAWEDGTGWLRAAEVTLSDTCPAPATETQEGEWIYGTEPVAESEDVEGDALVILYEEPPVETLDFIEPLEDAAAPLDPAA